MGRIALVATLDVVLSRVANAIQGPGFFRPSGRVQISLCSLSARPSFADRGKRPRVRRKKPARERRAGEEEETALANAPTKPTPSPKTPSPHKTRRETYHDT